MIYNSGPGKWACRNCTTLPSSTNDGILHSTVHYKWYNKKNGNVSAARVNMVRNRCLSPDDGRSVVMRGVSGVPSDRKAVNF